MRTHGHRKRNIAHQGLLVSGELGRDSRELGDRGGIALGEIPNVDDGVMDAANHYGTCTPT